MFPILERTLATRELPTKLIAEEAVEECMTVNRVLHEHPETRRVFEELFVNLDLEGVSCLDEVAWRHGMEAEELVASLNQAIGTPQIKTCTEATVACGCQ